MQIAILGTGIVGQTLARGLSGAGHDVVVGTRDPADSGGRDETADLRLATFADAVAGSELVVNATGGQATLLVAEAVAGVIGDRVLVDVSNPLDFSFGFPPTLTVKDTDSLGEQLQRALPTARVVKTLNTLTAGLMIATEARPAGTTLFVSGDDTEAKDVVRRLLADLGHTDVIDLGDLSTARGTEMYLALWVRVMSALGTPDFAVTVTRG